MGLKSLSFSVYSYLFSAFFTQLEITKATTGSYRLKFNLIKYLKKYGLP